MNHIMYILTYRGRRGVRDLSVIISIPISFFFKLLSSLFIIIILLLCTFTYSNYFYE